MAIEHINVGASPNDKTGDTLRVAFQKVNANFDEFIGSGEEQGAAAIPAPAGLSVADADFSIDTVSDLRALPEPNLRPGKTMSVHVRGYYEVDDGFGGFWYWQGNSNEADDGATVIRPNSSPVSGRWKRVMRGDVFVDQFGARGSYDKVTQTGPDDSAAIRQACIYGMLTGETIRFSSGRTYLWNTAQAGSVEPGNSVILTNSLRIAGEPGATIVRKERDGEVARSIINRAAGDTSEIPLFYVSGITFEGEFSSMDEELPSTTYMGPNYIKHVKIENCVFRNIAKLTVSCSFCDVVEYVGNLWENCARDGARAIGSRKVIVRGNTFYRVHDDCVAVGMSGTVADPAEMQAVVTGNNVIESQGFYFAGGHRITVTDNTFVRAYLRLISVNHSTFGPGTPEGDHPVFGINISGNVIIDPHMRTWLVAGELNWQSAQGTPGLLTRAIEVSGMASIPVGSKLAGTVDGSSIVQPYGSYYTNNTSTSAPPVVPRDGGVVISNNVIKRTLRNDNVMYSSYGFGLPPTKYNALSKDLMVTPNTHQVAGVALSGYLGHIKVIGNHFEGIDYVCQYNEPSADLEVLELLNNTCIDIRKAVVGTVYQNGTSTARIKSLITRGNLFDLDPYYIAATSSGTSSRRANGSFNITNISGDGYLVRALAAFAAPPDNVVIKGNTLKNLSYLAVDLSDTVTSGSRGPIPQAQIEDNEMWFGTASTATAVGGSNNACGIGQVPVIKMNRPIYYDADRTSGTFGQVQQSTSYSFGTAPTEGFYMKGHVVYRSNESTSTPYLYLRLTTGTSHVLGTDWLEVGKVT